MARALVQCFGTLLYRTSGPRGFANNRRASPFPLADASGRPSAFGAFSPAKPVCATDRSAAPLTSYKRVEGRSCCEINFHSAADCTYSICIAIQLEHDVHDTRSRTDLTLPRSFIAIGHINAYKWKSINVACHDHRSDGRDPALAPRHVRNKHNAWASTKSTIQRHEANEPDSFVLVRVSYYTYYMYACRYLYINTSEFIYNKAGGESRAK